MLVFSVPTSIQLPEVSQFIASINQHQEHHNPWLGKDTDSILRTLSEISFEHSFILVTRNGKLVGALGFYPFPEQQVIRLLGPFIQTDDWNQTLLEMWNQLLTIVPGIYTKCRVSFDEQNKRSVQFFEQLGFTVYNAEALLELDLVTYTPLLLQGSQPSPVIRPYTSDDSLSFTKLHPQDAYFSANDVLNRLNETQKLFVLESEQQMVGYTYVEVNTETQSVEICFIRVLEEERNKQYGSKLLSYVTRWAKQLEGITRIELSVRLENTAARRLYERFGFRETSACINLENTLE